MFFFCVFGRIRVLKYFPRTYHLIIVYFTKIFAKSSLKTLFHFDPTTDIKYFKIQLKNVRCYYTNMQKLYLEFKTETGR